MAVPENGWSTLAEAVTYFANERLVTTPHYPIVAVIKKISLK